MRPAEAAPTALDERAVAVYHRLEVVVATIRTWDGSTSAADPAALATEATAVAQQMSDVGTLLDADGATKLATSSKAGAERALGTELQRLAPSLVDYAAAVSDHDVNAIVDKRGAIDVGFDRFTPFYVHYATEGVKQDADVASQAAVTSSHHSLVKYAIYLTAGLLIAGLLAKLLTRRRALTGPAPAGGHGPSGPPIYKPVLASMPEVDGSEHAGLFGLAGHVDAAPLAGFGAPPAPSPSFLATERSTARPTVARVPPPPPVPIRGPMAAFSSTPLPPPPPPAR